MKLTRNALSAAVLFALTSAPLAFIASAQAQAPPPAAAQRFPRQGPPVVSPEVHADRSVTFRLVAPQADAVQLTSSDIPGPLLNGGTPAGFGGPAAPMTKNADGVWEATVGPLAPGAYRYTFRLAGVSVVDPRNPAASESVGNTWSLVDVPGSETFDTRNVPHGAIASVTYYSTALGRFRRMHVYTPPGYEGGSAKYPVFYLLHGSGDSDDSWSTAGRAGFILDNLIADKKVVPMVIVMPAGHTRTPGMGGPPGGRRHPAARRVRGRLPDRHHALRGEELPHPARPPPPSHRGAFDGRRPDDRTSPSPTWTSSPTSAFSAPGRSARSRFASVPPRPRPHRPARPPGSSATWRSCRTPG